MWLREKHGVMGPPPRTPPHRDQSPGTVRTGPQTDTVPSASEESTRDTRVLWCRVHHPGQSRRPVRRDVRTGAGPEENSVPQEHTLPTPRSQLKRRRASRQGRSSGARKETWRASQMTADGSPREGQRVHARGRPRNVDESPRRPRGPRTHPPTRPPLRR